MKLLLISNSTNAGEAYLAHPKQQIKAFLGEKSVKALFIPFAAVTFSYEEYEDKVNKAFAEIGHSVVSIHRFDKPKKAVREAEAIIVGGGNTWHLHRKVLELDIVKAIKKRVKAGVPFVGWSAGSNLACPTIMTTNDMPIIRPKGFKALKFVPFQINPHYLDANPDGHAGETREARIEEYIEVNKETRVVGLREGSMLWYENENLKLVGPKNARIFKYGKAPREVTPDDDINFLMK